MPRWSMAAFPEAPIAENGARRIMSGRASDSASRMRTGPAKVQAFQRHPIIGGADHRAGAEQLIEPHLAVEDVPADEPEPALEIERRMDLPPEHGLGEARRVRIDRRDDLIRRLLPLIVPTAVGPEVVAEMLAE